MCHQERKCCAKCGKSMGSYKTVSKCDEPDICVETKEDVPHRTCSACRQKETERLAKKENPHKK
ncbi:uncharacterized protein RAG0_11002 [Rhynchosporium agropyri]|uniref:Uncharacterized protein n=3 Tax=Rhynchosporium TaxID=38037 RepID=A0A1E1M5R6_RHYSE|nr:uncharacterized protein RAG0_11002 [Rhynchosporium agropyri]CZT12757.1 uncharacterized protein RCO7_15195 [Rhynchosporium commune]CZT44421.1 uncharacterized protein RSE6_04584 [Rhynchosporium secalis]